MCFLLCFFSMAAINQVLIFLQNKIQPGGSMNESEAFFLSHYTKKSIYLFQNDVNMHVLMLNQKSYLLSV